MSAPADAPAAVAADTREVSNSSPKRRKTTNPTTDNEAAATATATATATTTTLDPDDIDQRFVRLSIFGEHKKAVSCVQFAPPNLVKSGKPLVASGSADGSIKIWDLGPMWNAESLLLKQHSTRLATQAAAATVAESGAAATNATATTNNNNNTDPATASSSSAANINRRAIPADRTCYGHTRGINDISWNTALPLLVSASDDKTLRVWDAVTGTCVNELCSHDHFCFCVDQNAHVLVSGSFDETVKCWDLRAGTCITTLPAHSDPVTGVALSHDNTMVASASHDGLVRLWDVATGECLKTMYAAHNPPVSSVRFTPNSKYLLACTLDSTIRLWPVQAAAAAADSSTGTTSNAGTPCVKTYQHASYYVNTKYSIVTDFLPDGQHFVSGSETGEALLWNVQTGAVTQRLPISPGTAPALAVASHRELPLIVTGSFGGGGGGGGDYSGGKAATSSASSVSSPTVDFWARQDYLDGLA